MSYRKPTVVSRNSTRYIHPYAYISAVCIHVFVESAALYVYTYKRIHPQINAYTYVRVGTLVCSHRAYIRVDSASESPLRAGRGQGPPIRGRGESHRKTKSNEVKISAVASNADAKGDERGWSGLTFSLFTPVATHTELRHSRIPFLSNDLSRVTVILLAGSHCPRFLANLS